MERLPGFRDFYPEPVPHPDVWSADLRQYIFGSWRDVAHRYGFAEYDGPPLEPLELYTIKSGEEIVGQLFNFADKGNRAVAMRPEMTPTLARMVATHERNYKKPIRWFTIPQLFRYEKQQKGRMREHFQLNADLLGENDPAADAEIIALLIDLLRAFGLTHEDFVIRLSSREAWKQFFNQHCQDTGREYEFYQVIDKLEREDPSVTSEKLLKLGLTFEQVTSFIQKGEPTTALETVIQNLTARGLSEYIKIDYNIIRGLAYYTGIVFEAFDKKGEFRAIAGGGRYDHLVKLISGGKVALSAIGFGMGDVVLTELLRQRKLLPDLRSTVDVFCLIEEETLRNDTLKLIQTLRDKGLIVDYCLTPLKPEKQFKKALDARTSFTVRLEKAIDGNLMARIKNMDSREEKMVPAHEVTEHVG